MDNGVLPEKPYYLLRSPREADLRFYQGYDANFLFRKADLLHIAYAERDRFTAFATSLGYPSEAFDDSYFQGIVAELHCAALQQFECLFALMLAALQDLPHWIYLTRYRTGEIKQKATALVSGQLSKLSNNRCASLRDFVSVTVYPGVTPSESMDENWRSSLEDLGWFLNRMADRYLSSNEYNAYKHGLRVLPGPAQLLVDISGGVKDFRPVLTMKHALSFLEISECDNGYVVQEVTKEIDPDDSYHAIYIMAAIAETIQNIRIGGLTGAKVDVPIFKIDRAGLGELRPVGKMTMPY